MKRKVVIYTFILKFSSIYPLPEELSKALSETINQVRRLITSAVDACSEKESQRRFYNDFLFNVSNITFPAIERFARFKIIDSIRELSVEEKDAGEALCEMIDTFYTIISTQQDLVDSPTSSRNLKEALKEANLKSRLYPDILQYIESSLNDSLFRMKRFLDHLISPSQRASAELDESILINTEKLLVAIALKSIAQTQTLKEVSSIILDLAGGKPGEGTGNKLDYVEYLERATQDYKWLKPKKQAFAFAMASGCNYDQSLAFCEIYFANEAPRPVFEYAQLIKLEYAKGMIGYSQKARMAYRACKQICRRQELVRADGQARDLGS